MWRIIEAIVAGDDSRGVLYSVIETLHQLGPSFPDRVVSLVDGILSRTPTEGSGQRLWEVGIAIVTRLYVGRNHDGARAIVQRLACRPEEHTLAAILILGNLRGALISGLSPVDENDPIRLRAFTILTDIQRSLCGAFREFVESHGLQNLPEPQRERLIAVIKVAGDLALELQLAVEHLARGRESLSFFYQQAHPIIAELAAIGHPGVVHRLVRALEICVPVDPRGVFLQLALVVRSGARWRYQFESMGRDAVVRLVERYLAEYRSLLQDDQDCQDALRETLEVFLRVGWPSARRLVYRLGEIFR